MAVRNRFVKTLKKHNLSVTPLAVETIWLNITNRCNQSCSHCHIGASPSGTREMDRTTMDRCLEILAANSDCRNLDITGGAPELSSNFRYLVAGARKLQKNVIVRHNLTVTLDRDPVTGEDLTYLPAYFAENGLTVLASLPTCEQETTDRVRGRGTFEKSIRSLGLLNAQGYGREGSGLVLNLVYNHNGALCPDDRMNMESRFKRQLLAEYGVVFNELMAVTNMPINRFRRQLTAAREYCNYMYRLEAVFSGPATAGLVCRSLVSVGYDGRLYDCDFNQALGLQIAAPAPMTVDNFDMDILLKREIKFAPHCFGCTAGGGSS